MEKDGDQFEAFVDALERMIDAQDDMWEEEKYSNYREMAKIREERLIPAKGELKKSLDDYIDTRIKMGTTS
jgi:acyl carrier protein phosphodiesterase